MEVPAAQTAALIGRLRPLGGRAILNLAPAQPLSSALLRQIDLLVANEGEAASLGEAPSLVAASLRQGLVVTRGAEGATAYLADGNRLEVPALPVAAVDTTGAGDTFVGVLATGLDEGLPLLMSLRRASAAAALACLSAGAQAAMPDRAAIDAAAARLP
jgi:ribokinase